MFVSQLGPTAGGQIALFSVVTRRFFPRMTNGFDPFLILKNELLRKYAGVGQAQ
jgi:hypothetical protein